MQRTDPAEPAFLGSASAHWVWTTSDVASAFSDSEASSASASEPRAAVTNAAEHRLWDASSGTSENPFHTESLESEASDTQGHGQDDVRGEPNAGAMEEALKLHETGKCNPCGRFRRNGVCLYGNDCNFCHLPHSSFLEKRARPRKNKRVRYRRFIDVLEGMYPDDPRRMVEVAQELSSDKYLHNIVMLRASQSGAGSAGSARGGGDGALSDPAGCSRDGTALAQSVAVQRASGDDARLQRSQPAQALSASTGVGAGGVAARWAAAASRPNGLELRLQSYIQSRQ